MSHGYKRYALTLMTEILSMALGGYGRTNDNAASDGEANSVFIQIMDPQAFGSLQDFKQQINAFKALVENSRTKEGDDPVRLPGQRAWQRRLDQLENGVDLYPSIVQDLNSWAEALNVAMPEKL